MEECMHNRKAFTMAEVLITLGIIGIIAAMTIPNLMGAYRKKVVETELQRAFSIISQTIKMSEVYNENAAFWGYTNISNAHERHEYYQKFNDIYIKPYLKYLSTGKNIFNVYYSDRSSSYLTTSLDKSPHYKLADGLFLEFTPTGFGTDIENNRNGYIMIVYVGTTNRNKKEEFVEGKNLFAFTVNIDDSSSKVGLAPQWYLDWSCQKLANNRTTFINNCRKNPRETSGVSSSIYCTYMIYCNNWTVPKDYPIKF